jgi:hypothetical protein
MISDYHLAGFVKFYGQGKVEYSPVRIPVLVIWSVVSRIYLTFKVPRCVTQLASDRLTDLTFLYRALGIYVQRLGSVVQESGTATSQQ